MTGSVSLRWRLIIGSLLWTLGLAAFVSRVSLFVVSRHGSAFLHNSALLVLALGCMALGIVQVERGMSSLKRLRARLSMVREGHETRIAGAYPAEVQPLVDELNALLEERDKAVARAQSRAGDLAHGLKTPLAVLSQEAQRSDAARTAALAATVSQQVERMRRQIDYHLAHTRTAASGAGPGVRCSVAASVDGLVRTLGTLYAERGLEIAADVAPDHTVRARREDLDEMLGNLLDNACKWARSRVDVRSVCEGPSIAITVDDDGPGVDRSMYDVVLQRGVRADEAAPGSGLGLAIVCDLVELHGGGVALDRAPTGGLRARVTLPCCSAADAARPPGPRG